MSNFQVCDNRKDDWADMVRIRLSDPQAASDLHTADAMYHNDCRKTFMGGRNITAASRKETVEVIPSDEGFQSVKKLLENDRKKM